MTVTVKDAAAAATLVLAERAADEYKDDDTAANDGTEDGLIVVTNAAAPVTNFIGVQFSINNTADVNYDKVEYEIVPADGFALLYDADADVYEINVKPVNGTAPAISEDAGGQRYCNWQAGPQGPVVMARAPSRRATLPMTV